MRATTRRLAVVGGPADGADIVWVAGYHRVGDLELIDGLHMDTGQVIPPAVYRTERDRMVFDEAATREYRRENGGAD